MKFKTDHKDKTKRRSKNFLTKGAFGTPKPRLNDGQGFKVIKRSERVKPEEK